VEILVVLAVMGLMVATVVIGFGAGRAAEVARATNQLANLVRYGYDKARVTGDHYRLLIDLDKGTFTLQRGDDRMYLPATDRDGRIIEMDERELEDRAERDRQAAESYNRSLASQVLQDDDGETGSYDPFDPFAVSPREVPRRKPPVFAGFEDENALSKLSKPFGLADGVKVVYVRTVEDLEPITEGEASLYFFPRGRTQLSHIQIRDEDGEAEYTIKVQPLTGRVTIEDGLIDLELPDDRREREDDLGRRQDKRSF
jgi:general secretion pathway protein H